MTEEARTAAVETKAELVLNLEVEETEEDIVNCMSQR